MTNSAENPAAQQLSATTHHPSKSVHVIIAVCKPCGVKSLISVSMNLCHLLRLGNIIINIKHLKTWLHNEQQSQQEAWKKTYLDKGLKLLQ